MARLTAPKEPSSILRQRLSSFVDPRSSADAEGWNRLSLKKAKELVAANTTLKQDKDTSLWFHVEKKASHGTYWYDSHSPGYFQVFWPSGRFLTKKLQEKPNLINGKHILSIGPGSGLLEMHLAKKHAPELMACADRDVLARAALELNAEANDIDREKFVIITHPQALASVKDGRKNYRLYDTVIAADCLYNIEYFFVTEKQELDKLAGILKGLHDSGADVVIAQRDYAEVRRRDGRLTDAEKNHKTQEELGLTDKYRLARQDVLIDDKALAAAGLQARHKYEPVNIHHWPAAEARRPLPRLDFEWWKPPQAKRS